jgi:hypothetical protein
MSQKDKDFYAQTSHHHPTVQSCKSLCIRLSRLNVKIAVDKSTTMTTNTKMPVKIITLKFTNIDWNFFYGLIHLARTSTLFKRLVFEFFVIFLLNKKRSTLLKHQVSKMTSSSSSSLSIEITLKDIIHFLKNCKLNDERHLCLKDTFLLIKLKSVNLIETNSIIRAW